MGIRVVGIKEEARYGVAESAPDFHQEVSKAKASLNSTPNTKSSGSRMKKKARAGVYKPTANIEGEVDLKRIGHYLKAFLDNYYFTDGGSNPNVHEFWGGENNKLSSFTLWVTFDIFEKTIVGSLLDNFKMEVSDEYMKFTADFVYKTETSDEIDDMEDYAVKLIDGDWALMFYDVSVEIDESAPPGIVSSFSFEGKNNINVDKTIGLGSRGPQRKASAQGRDIAISFVSTLERETLELIQKAEYGEVGNEPSECKLCKIPLKLICNVCEDTTDRLEITFPECIFAVDYELSEADEIEVTFNLDAMGTGYATKLDGTRVLTDMYCRLVNDQPEIKSGEGVTSATVRLTVKDENEQPVSGNVAIVNRVTDEGYEATTGSAGGCSFNDVAPGRYDVVVEGYDVVSGSIISVNDIDESFDITVEEIEED